MLLLGWFLFLAATDWIDGRLAILLRQRTTFGARLDSIADAAMYGALLLGCIWLKGEAMAGEAVWIAMALACYAISCTASLVKFGRLPSHHTYTAKLAWAVSVAAAVLLLLDWATWPLRTASVAIAVANLESTTITLALPHWQADVPGVWRAIGRD